MRTFFDKLCEAKIEPILIPFYAAIVIPVAFLSGLLAGWGHGSPISFLPSVTLAGPLPLLLASIEYFDQNLNIPKNGLTLVFSLYLLYLVYGYTFFLFINRKKVLVKGEVDPDFWTMG